MDLAPISHSPPERVGQAVPRPRPSRPHGPLLRRTPPPVQLRKKLRQAFMGGPPKQPTIVHASIARLLSAEQLSREQINRIQVGTQTLGCALCEALPAAAARRSLGCAVRRRPADLLC